MKKVILLVVSLMIAFSFTGCGADNASVGKQESTGTAPTNESDLAQIKTQAVDEPQPKQEAENTALAMGTASTLGDFAINVTAAECKKKIESSDYFSFEADEGNQFLIVSVYVENNGKNADTFLPSFGLNDDVYTKAVFNGEFEYSSTQLLAYDSDLHDSVMNPLTSKSGVIAFQVPDKVADSTEALEIIFGLGTDKIAYTLR